MELWFLYFFVNYQIESWNQSNESIVLENESIVSENESIVSECVAADRLQYVGGRIKEGIYNLQTIQVPRTRYLYHWTAFIFP